MYGNSNHTINSVSLNPSQDNQRKRSSAVETATKNQFRNGVVILEGMVSNSLGAGKKENQATSTIHRGRHKKSRTRNSIRNSITSTSSSMQESDNLKGSRRGDPRMNAAVEARLADPAISLLDALLVGGFVFPGHTKNESGDSFKNFSDHDIFDDEGISLRQRKNQLGRRTRTIQRLVDSSSYRCDMEGVQEQASCTSAGTTTNVSNSNLDFSRALVGTIAYPDNLRMAEEKTSPLSYSTIATNFPSSGMLPPQNSASIDHEILKSHLLKQLSQTNSTQPRDLLHSLLQSNNANASAYSRNDAASSDLLLQSALLLQQKAAQQIPHFSKVLNRDYPNQLLNSSARTSIPSTLHINRALDQQQDFNEQLQNQIQDLQNYIHLRKQVEKLRLRQQGHLREQQQERTESPLSTDSDKKVTTQVPSSRKRKQQERTESPLSTDLDKKDTTPRIASRKRKKSSHSISDNDEDNTTHKKKTAHSHISIPKEKDDEEETIKTSSPRLKSAMKRFTNHFNKFTQSCMIEAGYSREECFELLSTFQNEVIRESMNRKR